MDQGHYPIALTSLTKSAVVSAEVMDMIAVTIEGRESVRDAHQHEH